MADRMIEDAALIKGIIDEHPRLKYLLQFEYKVPLERIKSLRLDGDNNKLDVNADRLYRFKALDSMDVLRPKFASPDVMERALDPALAQAVLVAIADYAGG